MSLTFPYKAVPSALFGVVYRPVADVLVRCKDGEEWVSITKYETTFVQPRGPRTS